LISQVRFSLDFKTFFLVTLLLLFCKSRLFSVSAEPINSASQELINRIDSSGMTFQMERRLGDRIARDLYRDPDYLDDPVIADYLQSIWQPLLTSARKRSELPPDMDSAFAWQLLQGRDRTVNAFALPGGYFGIHLGLVGVVGSKDELASVLAHELSHVTQRHIARLIRHQNAQTPWMLGAMILGALAASKNPAGAQAVIAGGQAVAAQAQLNFSRDMEREADRAGFGVLTQAGFAPQGFVRMFEKLQHSQRNNDTGSFPYLRSHPLTTERIADMQSRINEEDVAISTADLEHAMIAARARLLSNTAVDALRSWYVEAAPVPLSKQSSLQQTASLYGATLAATKLRNFDKAAGYLLTLHALVKEDIEALRQWHFLSAELVEAEGNPHAALASLGFKSPPKTRAELLAWVRLHISIGQAGMAAEAAQLWVLEHSKDASMWQQLARARAAQRRMVESVRAEAEVNLSQMDFSSAIERLKAAQKLAKNNHSGSDDIEASIVDVRLRLAEQLLREQQTTR
jgi:predicted Zn-dependent protease